MCWSRISCSSSKSWSNFSSVSSFEKRESFLFCLSFFGSSTISSGSLVVSFFLNFEKKDFFSSGSLISSSAFFSFFTGVFFFGLGVFVSFSFMTFSGSSSGSEFFVAQDFSFSFSLPNMGFVGCFWLRRFWLGV